MLDVITDFWKPVSRKAPTEEKKVVLDDLQVGCTIGFGFVPQAAISGRRMQITGLNVYQFGNEMLESFVLAAEQDAQISLIVAEADGERYLALSRRLNFSERMKLFEANVLDAIIDKPDTTELRSKDGGDAYKGWLVPLYNKQIHALQGKILKGDSSAKDAQEFDYYLLVSPNNEHAVEIEKYKDGRVEICATVYRRLSDIGQISSPSADGKAEKTEKPEAKAESKKPAAPEAKKAEAEVAAAVPNSQPAIKLVTSNDVPPPAAANIKTETKPEPKTETKNEMEKPMNLSQTEPMLSSKLESVNGSKSEFKAANEPFGRAAQNAKVQPPEANDAVECELSVATKVIEEAIRSETRLSDMMREILELPVVRQDLVSLPILLEDDDYKLLAARYGLSASDRNAIRRRIVDDINDFTGSKKKSA